MALAAQSGLTLDQFGARAVVGRLVSASMIKELGPVLTALMLTGRIGSGIAAELGSMMVTDQINALRALGTDPVRKLVVPRMLAGFLMTPVLTVISDCRRHHRRLARGAIPAAGEQRGVLVVGHQRPVHAGRVGWGWSSRSSSASSSSTIGVPRRHAHQAAAPRAWASPRPSRWWPVRSLVIAADFFVNQILIALLY